MYPYVLLFIIIHHASTPIKHAEVGENYLVYGQAVVGRIHRAQVISYSVGLGTLNIFESIACHTRAILCGITTIACCPY